MPTDIIKTISPNSTPVVPDYTSLQAWEDAAPADLIAADQRWIGECLDQGAFTQAGGTILLLSGSTADATRYKYLRCASGASWKDKGRSRPFYFDENSGVAIKDTGGGGYGAFLGLSEAGWKLEGLQIYSPDLATISAGGSVDPARIDKCIIIGTGRIGNLEVITNVAKIDITNCLVVAGGGSGGGTSAFGFRDGPVRVLGCTIIAVNDHTASKAFSYLYNGNTVLHNFVNNAFFGWSDIGDDPIFGSWSGDYNATDLGAMPWGGTHNQVSLTFANQFVSTTNDFRPLDTGGLHAGNPDTTYLPTDATGLTRDATTPWIGAWELQTARTVVNFTQNFAGSPRRRYGSFARSSNIVVIVPTVTLSTSAFAPTVRTPRTVVPPVKALTTTTFVPQLQLGVIPPKATLTTSTFAPLVRLPKTVVPPKVSIVTTAFAPKAVIGTIITVGTRSLSLTTFRPIDAFGFIVPKAALTTTRFAPQLGLAVSPPTKSLTTSTFAPIIVTPRLVVPGKASLILTTFAPATDNSISITPPTATIVTTTFAPIVSSPRLVTPGKVSLVLGTFRPVLGYIPTPPTRALSLSRFAPLISTPRLVVPPTKALSLAKFAPTAITPRLVVPGTTSLIVSSFAPKALSPRAVTPGTITTTLSSFAPSISLTHNVRVTVGTANLLLARFPPLIVSPRTIIPGTASVVLTTFAPFVSSNPQVFFTVKAILSISEQSVMDVSSVHVMSISDPSVLGLR